MELDKLVTRKKIAKTAIISFLGMFIIPRFPWISGTAIGKIVAEHFVIEWVTVLLILVPLRAYLDRREARKLMEAWERGEFDTVDLTAEQRIMLVQQQPAPGWLGSKWLEKILMATIWILFVPMAVLLLLVGLILLINRFLPHPAH